MKAGLAGQKVAIIASSSPPVVTGGISSAHYNLFLALKHKGFDVRLFTFMDHESVRQTEEGVIRHGTSSWLLQLLKILHQFYFYALFWLGRCQFAYQFPYIWESACGSWKMKRSLKVFRPDVIILPDNGAPGFFLKKSEGCRTIFISHHNSQRFKDEPLFGKFSRIDAKLAGSIEERTLKKVDRVICPSRYMKGVFEKTHSFNGPVAIIPNLVDSELIASIPVRDIRGNLSLPEDSLLIYIPSAGTLVKGARFVFEIIRRIAVSQDRDIGFYLSGGLGDEMQKRELSYAPQNAKIYSPGYVSYFENISIIKSCSFCISPTLTESFGMAILEANFCGLPVVAFASGGNTDVITDGINGFLAPFMDIEQLIVLSLRLLNDDLRKDMSRLTASLLRDKFDLDSIVDSYIRFIFEPNTNKQ